jgi:hypothetical protein
MPSARTRRHTDQWALFGLGLPPAYYANEAVSQVTGHGSCWNFFERWAGFEDGGYDECERQRSGLQPLPDA